MLQSDHAPLNERPVDGSFVSFNLPMELLPRGAFVCDNITLCSLHADRFSHVNSFWIYAYQTRGGVKKTKKQPKWSKTTNQGFSIYITLPE